MNAAEIVSLILGILGTIGIAPLFYSIWKNILKNKIIKYSDQCRNYLINFYNTQDEKYKKTLNSILQNFSTITSIEQCNNFLNIFELDKSNTPQWYIYKFWKNTWNEIKNIYFYILKINENKMSRYIEINSKLFIFVGMSHNTILESQDLINQNKKIKSKFNKIKREYAKTHYNNSYFLLFVEANCGIKNAEIWWEIAGKYKLDVNIPEELFKEYQEKTNTTENELKNVSLNTENLNISFINIIRKNNKWKYNKSILPCDETILNKIEKN